MGTSLLNGVEGIFIPVKNPAVSAQWYETILGFKLNYIEEEAAVMVMRKRNTLRFLIRMVIHLVLVSKRGGQLNVYNCK